MSSLREIVPKIFVQQYFLCNIERYFLRKTHWDFILIIRKEDLLMNNNNNNTHSLCCVLGFLLSKLFICVKLFYLYNISIR